MSLNGPCFALLSQWDPSRPCHPSSSVLWLDARLGSSLSLVCTVCAFELYLFDYTFHTPDVPCLFGFCGMRERCAKDRGSQV